MVWLLNAGDALVITQMVVPSHVQRGSDLVLRCLYDLDGDSLYSIKWYKGSHGRHTNGKYYNNNNTCKAYISTTTKMY